MTHSDDTPIPCIEVVELITDYLEGQLDRSTARRVEHHLTLCPPCVTYVEQIRRTVRSVEGLPDVALGRETVAALEAAFRDFHRAV